MDKWPEMEEEVREMTQAECKLRSPSRTISATAQHLEACSGFSKTVNSP